MWQQPYLWWAAFGFLLLIVEMMSGTFFFLALAAAAFVTTGVAWISDDLLGQWVAFALAGLVALAFWYRLRHRRPHHGADPASEVNNRLRHLQGRQAVLSEPIRHGAGRVNLDDSWWKVTGPDLPAGATVRVTAIHGMILTVESVDKPT